MEAEETNRMKFGFTLVELLVVIAIIAVLLSVLMPALNKVRIAAAGVVCASQLKDLGSMMEVYAAENKGRMVPSHPYTQRWWDRLGKMYNRKLAGPVDSKYDYKLFRCPIEVKKKSGAGGEYGNNPFFSCPVNDNGTPTVYTDDIPTFPEFWWSKKEMIKQPSTLPAFWDLNSDSPMQMIVSDQLGYPHFVILKYGYDKVANPNTRTMRKVTTRSTPNNGPAANHGRYINYLFADGHAGSNGFWPYDQKASPLTGAAISFTKPGGPFDYLTYFHPIRKIFRKGTSGKYTIGDGYAGPPVP